MEHLEEFSIPEKGKENLKDQKKLQKLLAEGKHLQEILGYTDEVMEKFYQAACNFFRRQQYEESVEGFVFLITLNPSNYSYWLGLAMSEHLTNEYHGALFAYKMASKLDHDNPIPHYHSAACHRALYDINKAHHSIDLAIEYSDRHEQYAQLNAQAKAAKKLLA